MKIAIATDGNSLKDKVALHFGRAKNFLIYDTETKSFEVYPNPEVFGKKELPPDFLVCKNVNVVTAFSLGPRAFEKFKNYNIKIYKALDGTILDNIQKFKDNKLREIKNKDIF